MLISSFGLIAATVGDSTLETGAFALAVALLAFVGAILGAGLQNRESRRRDVEYCIDEASAALPRVIHQLHQASDHLGVAEKLELLDDARLTAQEKCEIVEGRVRAKDSRLLRLKEMLNEADQTRDVLCTYQGSQIQAPQGITAAMKVRINQTEKLRDRFLESRRRERTWSRRALRFFTPS